MRHPINRANVSEWVESAEAKLTGDARPERGVFLSGYITFAVWIPDRVGLPTLGVGHECIPTIV
jgi:hypothetical protein